MLSHKNMTTNFLATALCHEYDHNHKTISFLPLSHVYERMMNYNFQSKGLSIYYVENLSAIATSIREVHPHIFNSVPRLLEQVYDKFVARGKALRGMKKHIYFWAVRLGNKYNPDRNSLFFKFRLKIADQLIYSKWRNALGGNLQTIVSGGAALQTRLARVFGAAGIQIFEGYGLTETAPVIAVNNQKTKTRRIGTVGPALEGVEVKIADDGEILCKGPNIMLGYYKAPELTEEVIDDEGWFHTGDMGELIDKKFLKITDRKKEMFKLSNGKYISPQVIENKFKESIFIEQLMVVGENEKYASAIISPNFNYLHNWATHYQIIYRDNKELIRNPKVLSKFQQEVNEKNKSLGANEQIKRFRLVADEWSTRSGELSPTLKLKRRFLFRKYDVLLREIYQNLNGQEKNTLSTYLQALQKNVSLPKLNTSLLKDIVRGNQKEEKPE
jgi:long-chain acyl-CoA synthetase